MLEINNWNLNPNREWFVKLEIVDTTKVKVSLFLTLNDAQSLTNTIAIGTSEEDISSSGTAVILTAENVSIFPIFYFNDQEEFHLKIIGTSSDSSILHQVKPFVDLPEIADSMYKDATLVHRKAAMEINKHTHTSIFRDLKIAKHYPNLVLGNVIQLNSSRLSENKTTVLEERTISGNKNFLVDSIITREYIDFIR